VTEKDLGLFWDVNNDNLTFKVKMEALQLHPKILTKRVVLRSIMKIFDIMGFVSHFIIRAKVIMQLIWRERIGWDQNVPTYINGKWLHWFKDLNQLSTIQILRCYTGGNPEEAEIQLHVFVDASEEGYAAISYFRCVYASGIEVA
jgi:hypothetical protein